MKLAIGLVIGLVCPFVAGAQNAQRTLTFEARVNAQAAIARVYYLHQDGATKPFEDAVPRSVHENKVRTYLEQSAALSLYWKTPVTDEALGRELERMTKASRMPERLNELFAALGNDPFLIKECLARPVLVERLTHNFQAMDPAMHVKEQTIAERLRSQVVNGQLDPSAEHPYRTVSEIEIGDAETDAPSSQRRSHQTFSRDQFLQVRTGLPEDVGQASEVAETRDDLGFAVILSETANTLRVAKYSVKKASWDDWWTTVRGGLDGVTVESVASEHAVGSMSRLSPVIKRQVACAEQGWHNGALDDGPNYGSPDGRVGHTAVWTGSEMLIFGGIPTNFQVDDHGKRYDPTTDTWTVMTSKNAPTSRTFHTAVWTGSSMIVWGGTTQGSSGMRQTGGRYDPNSDTWTHVSTRSAPVARYSHTAVWTGTEMVIWGGIGGSISSAAIVNTGGRYNPDTDTWRPTSTIGAPAPRSEHTAIWTGSRMIVWSGRSGGRYDPVADTWLPVSTSGPDAFLGHSAVWTGYFMVIWGGTHRVIDHDHDPQVYNAPTNAGARYNPATDKWSATSMIGAPPPRSGHAAVWTGTEMLIWGGVGAGRRYNVTTNTWTPISDTGAVAWGEDQTAVWTGHLMIAWGGDRHSPNPDRSLLNTGGRYDPASDSWTPTSVGSGAFGQTTVWTGSQMIVWGGLSGDGQRFDPATDSWSTMASAGEPAARLAHTAVWTGSSMVIWGGWDGLSGYFNSGGRYDPSTDSWTTVSTSGAPSARTDHRALWTGSEMLVWGGRDASDFLGTGGRYDPENDYWTAVSTTNAPSPRYEHTAIWTGTRMVIWGGLEQQGLLQTGARYDPQTDSWTPTSLSGAPAARYDHTAVWLGDRMVVWGGTSNNSSQAVASGGRYDPVQDAWTPTSTAGNLIGHAAHTALSTGRVMIVWGGRIGANPPFPARNTGLLYDPVADHWTKLSKTGEPETYSSASAIWTESAMIVWSGSRGGQFVPADPIDVDCDGDGVSVLTGDCDDADASTYPGAPPLCDGKINDCSNPSWPDITGSSQDRETDFDGDGFTICQGDRDDNNSTIYPGAPQLCDGIENDCSQPGWPTIPVDETDADHDGFRICQGDCDDTNPYVRPGWYESCNGVDDDCDGTVDEQPEASCGGPSACVEFICQGIDGCVATNILGPCDDGNQCTSEDTCQDGYCQGTLQVGSSCDDENPCTIGDTCDADSRCNGTPKVGMLCDDFNACTVNDACTANSHCSGTPVVGMTCDDFNACTVNDACSSGGYCIGTQLMDGEACDTGSLCSSGDSCLFGECNYGTIRDCDDHDRCTGSEYCDSDTGECVSYGVPLCDDGNECTADSCDPIAGCVFVPNDAPCDDGDACTVGDACVNGACLWGPVDDCDDGNPCTDDSCDVAVGCVHAPHAGACDDGNACTALDVCEGGICVGSNPVTCGAPAPCQAAGVCVSTTGLCRFDNVPDGATCSDGNPCTLSDACSGGSCVGGLPVMCAATDSCHLSGACDPLSGTCSHPVKPDGASCDDGELCTTGEQCRAGICTPAAGGLFEANPRTNGYYKRLCHGPHSGDQLTNADAACVAAITRTFAGISTVADLCAELEPSQPNNDPCDKTEDDLMVLALNACRSRICTAQGLDSQCGGNSTIGASLAEADAILSSPSRSRETCDRAKCLAEEINTGRALEMNSLGLRREGSTVRLSWNVPYLDDGSGRPDHYNVWRRPRGSLTAFTKIAETAELTFLDATTVTGAFDYEVTAVMN